MHHPTDRITHTTAFVTPVVEHWLEREMAQWVHPMKDRSDDPSHHKKKRRRRILVCLIFTVTMNVVSKEGNLVLKTFRVSMTLYL